MVGIDALRGEAEFGAERLQQGQVTGPAMTETEVAADPDLARAEPAEQHAADEVLGTHRCQRSVEDWENAALASQAKLIADARDSIAVTVDTSPDPMDVSHRYKPDPARPRKPEANGGQRGR